MINGLILVLIFIIGFAFGLAMPFILIKLLGINIYAKKESEEKQVKESNNISADVFNEWLNGKGGE